MYVGRFVIAGPGVGAYRVSSRSFPDRRIVQHDDEMRVVPTRDAPATDNPYVSYTCLKPAADRVVLGNGAHVDPIAEKLDIGYPDRDALAEVLLAMDFEKDDYDTPRLAGVVGETDASIGIVRRDAVHVTAVAEPTLVATYEKVTPEAVDFDPPNPEAAARQAHEMAYEHAVCAAGLVFAGGGFDVAIENGSD